MPRTATLEAPRASGRITPAEREVVEFFVHLGRYLSLPRSVGEIYGILFATGGTMTLDELVSRLRISKGSASQGLRLLRGVGAVRVNYRAGDRKDHYAAEVELPNLLRVFVRDQLTVRMNHANERLNALLEAVENPHNGAPEGLTDRVERLVSWQKKAKRLLPLVGTFLKM
jgi:DNA-binding transcriptional regulator GbsR (MarR family)